jgi:hypothetical protein
MKEKIDKLKSSMESKDGDHTEVVAALAKLDEQIGEGDVYPGKDLIGEELEKTVLELNSEEIMNGYISGRWKTLGERLEEWEKEHPGVTLVIGDIARALSISGL